MVFYHMIVWDYHVTLELRQKQLVYALSNSLHMIQSDDNAISVKWKPLSCGLSMIVEWSGMRTSSECRKSLTESNCSKAKTRFSLLGQHQVLMVSQDQLNIFFCLLRDQGEHVHQFAKCIFRCSWSHCCNTAAVRMLMLESVFAKEKSVKSVYSVEQSWSEMCVW